MSHKFHLDFKKSWITKSGPKLVTSNRQKSNAGAVQRKCYEFELLNWKERCPDKVQVAPIQLNKDEWLFGPASKLSTRSIVYPCSRMKCALPCPLSMSHLPQKNILISEGRMTVIVRNASCTMLTTIITVGLYTKVASLVMGWLMRSVPISSARSTRILSLSITGSLESKN